MIEDVTTSGKSMEETVPKVRGAADVTIVGLMVSLDRMEVGKGGVKCALDEVKDLYGFETNAIVTMKDVESICTTNRAMVKLLSMTRSRLQSTHTMSSMVQNKEELQ